VALQALAGRGDPVAVSALVLGLQDQDERIRGACIDGLGAVGAKGDAVPPRPIAPPPRRPARRPARHGRCTC